MFLFLYYSSQFYSIKGMTPNLWQWWCRVIITAWSPD